MPERYTSPQTAFNLQYGRPSQTFTFVIIYYLSKFVKRSVITTIFGCPIIESSWSWLSRCGAAGIRGTASVGLCDKRVSDSAVLGPVPATCLCFCLWALLTSVASLWVVSLLPSACRPLGACSGWPLSDQRCGPIGHLTWTVPITLKFKLSGFLNDFWLSF